MIETNLGSVLYTIRAKSLATYWSFLEIVVLMDPWACDFLYPVAHYALGHKCSTPQSEHLYLDLLDKEWNQTWAFWNIPPGGGVCLSSPQFLARCQAAGWGCPSPSSLSYLGSPLGSTDGTAVKLHRLYGWHCHHHNWCSAVWRCFPSPNWYVHDKGQGPRVRKFAIPPP